MKPGIVTTWGSVPYIKVLTVQVVCPEMLYSPALQGSGETAGLKQE